MVTEGILTRRLQRDPELVGTGLVIFDEVHERHLPTDLGLVMVSEVRATLRPDLRVLAMSATPDIAALTAVLDDPPVIESVGRMFPVDIRWAPRQRRDRLDLATARTVMDALTAESGDVLVFLPGIGEIMKTKAALEPMVPSDVDLFPLAGALSLEDQDRALAPSAPGRRRVVLSTDIAETSLTVEGVRVVVDSGLVRSPRFDVGTEMTRLVTHSTSRASANQRSGRAGRQEPGVCYRMWSLVEHGARSRHARPDIAKVDLAGLVLEVAAWGSPIDELNWPTPPPPQTVKIARDLLHDLGALDEENQITPLGQELLGLPVHPRLARMLVNERSALGCALAVLIDERDVLRGRPEEVPADLGIRLRLVTGRGSHDRADRRAVEMVRRRAGDLARRLKIRFDLDEIDIDHAGSALLHAFPDRLAYRRRGRQFQLKSGGSASVGADDPLAQEAFIVAAELDGKKRYSRIRLAAGVDADTIATLFGDQVRERSTLVWDHDRDDLVDIVERRLDSIQLGATTRPARPGADTTAALVDRVITTGLAVLGWNSQSLSLRQRVAFLHDRVGEPWPDWSVDTLLATTDTWLVPYLMGMTSRRDLEQLNLTTLLRSQLPWPAGADLDEIAPAELALPTGRSVPIDYSADEPTASVRVQDLYGTTTHPRAGDRPLVLHLLSPADRPIQVTSDLRNFWAGSWTEVRKELAGRYPKHYWPDNPATAQPRRLKKDR